MRIHLMILATTTLLSAVSAQTPSTQTWDMHPGVTSFTSRGNIGTGFGEVLQGVHQTTNRGVLDIGGSAAITRMSTITQDQNCSTRERFSYVVRSGTDTAGPLTSTGAVLGVIAGLSLPNSTRTTPCAWGLTSNLTASTAIKVPSQRHFSYGLRLPVGGAANWSMDGQSVHASNTAAQNSHATQEDHAWQIIGTASAAAHPSAKRTWRLSIGRQGAAVMKLRCGGRQGMGGSFPKASTSATPLAWTAQIRGGSDVGGGSTIVALAVTRTLNVPIGSGANLFITPPYFMFFGPAANAAGLANVNLLPFVPASASGAGTFPMQGAIGTSTVLKLTNSQSVKP